MDLAADRIPSSLRQPGALRFWCVVLLTGIGAGVGAIALTELLMLVQRWVWAGSGADLLDAAARASAWRHLVVLTSAGLLTGVGQVVLRRLASGNGIDITAAIWFNAGRLPVLRTLGSAVLSVIVVGMGAALGREGAPKQVGAVIANGLSDRARLSDEQRRLLVACGAGAGMAAAYGVPLGGALFALEVLRGALALRLILPALLAALAASEVAWLILPNAPTYLVPAHATSASVLGWALLAGPIAGVVAVGYVRAVTFAERHKPTGVLRIGAPVLALAALGGASIAFPQLLGNGRDVSQLLFVANVAPKLVVTLLFLRPLATILCVGSGTPGGLFTPSLTVGALLGGALGYAWSVFVPGSPIGLFAVLGAGAVLAATTQGPISSVVLLLELTGRDRSLIAPLLLVVITATLVSRMIEPRSIYDARLSEEQLEARLRARENVAI